MELIQTSVFCRFLMAIGALFSEAWKGCIFARAYRAILGIGERFLKWFLRCWPDSLLCRGLTAFCRWVGRCAKGSTVCRVIRRDGRLPAVWGDSVTCKVVTVLVNLPCQFLRWVYRHGKKAFDGSLCFKAVSGIGGWTYALIGVLLMGMLMVPHRMWDNRLALLGSILLLMLFYLGSMARPFNNLEVRELGPYLILFMAFVCEALLTSQIMRMSIRFVGFYLTGFLLLLLTVSTVKRYNQLHTLLWLMMLGLGVAVLYGCYQGVVGVDVVANQQDLALNAGMPGRVYSFFDNPNNFAEILIMLTPLTFALFLNGKNKLGKGIALIIFLMCVASLAFTYSRSGWLGFALAVMVFIAFMNWKLVPVMILLGFCCLPILPQSIYNRILTIGNTSDSSLNYRFAIYESTWDMTKDFWLTGVGLGSDMTREVLYHYPAMFDGNFPVHAHNNYLQMWSEMGIFGMISFIAMLLYQIKTGVKTFVACADKRVKTMLAAAVSGFSGILLMSVAEYTWFYPRNMFLFFFLMGVIAACVKLGKKPVRED